MWHEGAARLERCPVQTQLVASVRSTFLRWDVVCGAFIQLSGTEPETEGWRLSPPPADSQACRG